MEKNNIKVFSGTSNPDLSREISSCLEIPLCKGETSRFGDGEFNIRINENVRGKDVFIIQSTCPPVNENLMELLITVDAFRRASASRITAVIPYYGYGRQDRKVQPRAPITAKLVANLITKAGVDRVLVIDLHAGQIQGFFDIPVDNLFAAPPVLVKYFLTKKIENVTIVSPDSGGVERARAIAKRMNATLAIIDKRRPEVNVAEVMNVIGDVKGRNAVILDDMIDTGGSIIKAADALHEKGVKKIFAACTHPVFSTDAIERLDKSVIDEIVVTNTIPMDKKKKSKKIKVLSIAELLSNAIYSIHNNTSVSSLFV
ncbi:ribose-phosphate pyrophosphokinase [bacterium]|nr:ribose-phosphate pyrophosphokinase [bacterium]